MRPILSFIPLTARSIKKWLHFPPYIAIIILAMPNIISWSHRIIFLLYALFIFWILYDLLKMRHSNEDAHLPKNIWKMLFIFSAIFLLISRFIMFIRYGETPLGYDTGFYLQYFQLVTNLGTSKEALVIGRIAYAPWFPYFFIGLPGLFVINFLHILHQFLTAGSLYFLVRSFHKRVASVSVAVVALFLFTISINQFMAFWWIFFKQSMALPFLILALGLFIRRSWLAVPVAAFGAAIHLQTAVPFGLAFVLFFLYQIAQSIITRKPIDRELIYIGLSGLAAGVFLFLLKGTRDLSIYIEYFNRYKGLASNALAWEVARMKGLFINFPVFRLNTLFYLPFAVLGIITARSWFHAITHKRALFIPILVLVLLILSIFPFVYQNRALIALDLLVIVLAAYPLTLFIKHFLHDQTGKILLVMLFLGATLFTARLIWNQPPQLYPNEATELKQLRYMRKEGEYAMALSSLYTPWVYLYNDFQETIAPGWLFWDKWDLYMWQKFWHGNDHERRRELLKMYGDRDIYMFLGQHQKLHPNLKEFFETDSQIKQISPHMWLYSPNIDQPE